MTLPIFILLFIDLILLAGLTALWCRVKSQNSDRAADDRRISEMTQLRKSLEKLLLESARVSIELGDAAELSKREIKTLYSKLKQKEKLLTGSLDQNETSVNESDALVQKNKPGENNIDRYSEVLYLRKMGLSPNEISRKIGIPIGEIELVLSLRQ